MSFNQVTAVMSTIQSELKRLTSFWLSDRIGLYGSRASCRSASLVPSTDRQVKRGRTLRTSSLLQQQIGSTSPFIFTGTKSKGSSRSTVCHYPRKTSGPRRPVLTERLRQPKETRHPLRRAGRRHVPLTGRTSLGRYRAGIDRQNVLYRNLSEQFRCRAGYDEKHDHRVPKSDLRSPKHLRRSFTAPRTN